MSPTSCIDCPERPLGWYNIVYRFRHEVGDVICGLDDLINEDWESAGFCEACIAKCKHEEVEKKKELWAKLDEWFELDT